MRKTLSALAFGLLTTNSCNTPLFTTAFSSFFIKRTGKKFTDVLMASVSTSYGIKESNKTKKRMPITVLSGFLGAGKTSFLQYVLENDQGKRYGLIVNDVAAVNVDSKMIKKKTYGSEDGIDTLELQNGCVCCSLADDMLNSIAKLVSLSTIKGLDYDHIIVECSGIAEPRKIRDLFQEAEDYESIITESVKLDTLITLVDAKLFLEEFGSNTILGSKSDLAVNKEDVEGFKNFQQDGSQRQITELLLEQVECADIVIINKCDLLSDQKKDIVLVQNVIKKVNPNARILTCVYGEVKDPSVLLGSAGGSGAADWGILDEHRLMLQAAAKELEQSHDHAEAACAPDCKDPTHDHSHSHDHAEAVCAPDCKDPTHDHSHSHDHAHNTDATTAETRFGITSLVYKRRRPFHPIRFSLFLNGIGKLSIKGIQDIKSPLSNTNTANLSEEMTKQSEHPLLRSKGFVWMATSAHAAYFMSHAGQYLELSVLGRWWSDIPRKDWPQGKNQQIYLLVN
jgi:G3E family GTPase